MRHDMTDQLLLAIALLVLLIIGLFWADSAGGAPALPPEPGGLIRSAQAIRQDGQMVLTWVEAFERTDTRGWVEVYRCERTGVIGPADFDHTLIWFETGRCTLLRGRQQGGVGAQQLTDNAPAPQSWYVLRAWWDGREIEDERVAAIPQARLYCPEVLA